MPSITLIYVNADAGNKSVLMSKTAHLEIKQPKEVLCFGGPPSTSLTLCSVYLCHALNHKVKQIFQGVVTLAYMG